ATNASKLLSGLLRRSYGNPVARSASSNVVTALTSHAAPSRVAHFPATPVHSPPSAGATTAPRSGRAPSTSPTDTQKNGCPWTKCVVPSSGSTNHGGAPLPCSPPSSSPTHANDVGARSSRRRSSLARSNDVTSSTPSLCSNAGLLRHPA